MKNIGKKERKLSWREDNCILFWRREATPSKISSRRKFLCSRKPKSTNIRCEEEDGPPRCTQVLRACPSTRASSSFRGMIYNTHPDGGEDLVGLDVLEPVLLLAFVEQLQVRLEMRRTKGAQWKWRGPRRQMGWIASA